MKKLLVLFLNILFTTIIVAQIPGTLDLTFGNNGITLSDYSFNGNDNYAEASTLQADGKIVLAGHSSYSSVNNMTFMRYYSNGTLDDNFGNGGIIALIYGGSDDRVCDITEQADGKIISVGYTSNSTNTRIAITRLNTDGSLDTDFDGNGMKVIGFGSDIDAYGKSIAIQSDGKIIIGGYIRDENSDFDAVICRLNPNGTFDNNFGTNGIVNHNILSQMNFMNNVGIQDEKIILGGMSYDDDFFRFVTLCRYNTDGSLDTDFGTSGIVSVQIDDVNIAGASGDMCFSKDGKIVYACSVSDYPNYDFAVLRFLSNGSVDNSFGNLGMVVTVMDGNSTAFSVAVQDDNKIIAGGLINNTNSYDFALARYHENGFPDTGFGIDGTGVVITHASNGSIFYDDVIYSLLLQDDGKVIVSGYANTQQTGTDFAVARYYTGCFVGMDEPMKNINKFTVAPNPFTIETKLCFKLSETKMVKVEVFNSSGLKVTSLIHKVLLQGEHQLHWDANDLTPGIYFLRTTIGEKVYSEKIIKMRE